MRPDRPIISENGPNASKENSVETSNPKPGTRPAPSREARYALATKSLNSFSASSASPKSSRTRSFKEIGHENGAKCVFPKRSKIDKLVRTKYEREEDLWNNGEKIVKFKRADDSSLASVTFEKRGPFIIAPQSSIEWSMTDPSIDFENLELDSIIL